MSVFSKILLVYMILLTGMLNVAMVCAQLDETPSVQQDGALKNLPERNEQFMDWGLGMFVHWSLDSQLGSVISHSMVGASDDYLDRYINDLPSTFNPKRYDPNEWASIAKMAGVKYMVFTTKHHSGFCMWDTATTDFNIMNTPYGKDVVRGYVDACRKHGIKVGFYFSPEDFLFLRRRGKLIRRRGLESTAEDRAALDALNVKQIEELFTNYGDIDVAFLDGGGKEAPMRRIHELQPKCIVTRGEMSTPEQKLPGGPQPGPWESCFTLGTQWQYKPTNEDYKTGTQLINMLIETRAKGGNLLINVGPDPHGVIPFEQERVFRELGLWMFINREGIHDIRPCPVIGERDGIWYVQARDGKSVYVFLTQFTGENQWKRKERKEVVLTKLRATSETAISVLSQNDLVVEYSPEKDATSRFKQTEAGLEISVMRAQRIYNNSSWPNTIVVKLDNVDFAGQPLKNKSPLE